MRKFVRMYRVHVCKEDGILYPELRLLPQDEYQELTESIQGMFEKRLGNAQFEAIHKKLEAIEKQLDLEDIGVLTPRIEQRSGLVAIV